MNARGLFAAVALAVAGHAAQAALVVYTDRAAFMAAVTSPVVTDFNGVAPPNAFVPLGATFTGVGYTFGGNDLFIVNPGFDALYQWGSGDVLDLDNGTAGAVFLDPGVRAFGFDFGSNSNQDILIGGTTSYDGNTRPNFHFFGVISDGPIDPITLSWGFPQLIVDNIVVAQPAAGVPTPAPLALLAVAALAAGALRRRSAAR